MSYGRRKWFSEYPEFREGAKLPLPLDILVLKSFQLQVNPHDQELCPWTPLRALPPDHHDMGYITFSSYGSAAFDCIAQMMVTICSYVTRVLQQNKMSSNIIRRPIFVNMHISEMTIYLCPLLELTSNGK